ncbi:MAG: phage integrase N-terminal SAM-like domain-containing protein [Nitrospirota bacterium]|nr:phage integrase N-terminal SAM-like domain-containing protein [Nitrospirota bacterium]
MGKDQQGVDEEGAGNFWHDYLILVMSDGIPEAKARWYVKWAEQFARSVRSVPLRNRSAEHVSNYLQDLSLNPNVKGWQIEQATEALRVLYQTFLKIHWATQWPDCLTDTTNQSNKSCSGEASLPPETEPERFKDGGAWPADCSIHEDVMVRLRTQMRTLHYSLRTEQTYEQWIKRFFLFHQMKSPKEMGHEFVQEYLEYLAVVRKISASTQNQALNALVFLFRNILGEPLPEEKNALFTIEDTGKKQRYLLKMPTRSTYSAVNCISLFLTGYRRPVSGPPPDTTMRRNDFAEFIWLE